jgi:hypothetical protein
MKNKTPKNGRIVSVQTKYIGENSGYASPETFGVAIDDDAAAVSAVRSAQDFAPNDDRLVEVSNVHLQPSSIQALGMKDGDVFRI